MLRYRLEGSGQPLLLIHGWGVTFTIWRNLVPYLKPYFQLIMIELPGIGGSPDVEADKPYYPAAAETIEELRQVLGIEQWAVLAYSSGTRAGEAYLQRYASHVSRAVFLCPVYLTEINSLGLRFEGWLEHARPNLVNWILSDWRLYGLVLTLGFNGRRSNYVDDWINEIELQPIANLKRMLHELPGKGRAPFELPTVPTLFVWGRRDALTARPLRKRPNDVFISANHSAPMLAAPNVAEVVLPFLRDGNLHSHAKNRKLWKPPIPLRSPLKLAEERTQLPKLIRNVSRRRLMVPGRNTLRGFIRSRSQQDSLL